MTEGAAGANEAERPSPESVLAMRQREFSQRLEGITRRDARKELLRNARFNVGKKDGLITDANDCFLNMVGRAREEGIRPIIGAELTMEDKTVLPVLVESRRGYQNLCRLLTRAHLRDEKGKASVRWNELPEFAEGLVALTGDEEGPLITAISQRKRLLSPFSSAWSTPRARICCARWQRSICFEPGVGWPAGA